MSYLSMEKYSASQKKACLRVLDSLDRIDERLGKHYSSQRIHSRIDFRGTAVVCVRNPGERLDLLSTDDCFKVFARSVSQSGVSLIHPEKIKEKTILVGLSLPDGNTIWFQAEIMRDRIFQSEEIWEYGVAFRNKVETPQLA